MERNGRVVLWFVSNTYYLSNFNKKRQWQYEAKLFWKSLIILWEPTEQEPVLSAGQHTWNFSLTLPINLPPTVYFEDWTSVFYQTRGFIDPGKFWFSHLTVQANRNLRKKQYVQRRFILISMEWTPNFGVLLSLVTPGLPRLLSPIKKELRWTLHFAAFTATESVCSNWQKGFQLGGGTIHPSENWQQFKQKACCIDLPNWACTGEYLLSFTYSWTQHIKIHLKYFHLEFEEKKIASETVSFKAWKLDEGWFRGSFDNICQELQPKKHLSCAYRRTTRNYFQPPRDSYSRIIYSLLI